MTRRELLAVAVVLLGLLAGVVCGALGAPGACSGSIKPGCLISDQRVQP